MLAAEVDYAEEMLHAGLPLVECVPRELRIDIELFARGGLAILAAIRRLDYDVWTQRPVVTRGQKLKLLLRAWRASRGGPQ
jgi:phytoene/squalene synthetase